MTSVWNPADRQAWEALHAQSLGSLQQSWAYGEAMRALNVPVLRAVLPQASGFDGLAQFVCQRIPWPVRFALCSRGPVWRAGIDVEVRREWLASVRRSLPLRRPRLALFTPDLSFADPLAPITPFAGRARVMTGYTTVLLDLRLNDATLRAALEGKWRNRLAAAERAGGGTGLRVATIGARPSQYQWLLDAEHAQRDRRGYFSLPREFIAAYQAACVRPADALLALRADLGRERVAGMLFLIHGNAATYQIGWADSQGRELNAHNLLMWAAFGALRERGVRQLDLGGVNTMRGAGIARFKLGTGGTVVRLPGTYL